MIHAHCMKTVMGGLSLVLVLSACSSGSKSKTTSAPPSGDMSRSDDTRRGAQPTISPPTDLPRSDVVTDRGTSRRTVSDPTDRARPSDRSPQIAAACPSRTDAQGTVVFEDPTCPDRYRSQLGNTGNTSERDRALAAACSSRPDANGKIIYDDPACPDRYRRQAAAMSSIREARVRLSRAAGIKVWDTAPGAGTKTGTQVSPSSAQGVDPQCIDELERQCGEVQPGSGRIQQCFDDKINNFSPMCQEKLKEGKAAIAAAILTNRHDKEVSGNASDSRQTGTKADYAGVDPRCPSTIDAKGKVAYADAGCAERYRFQTKENAFYDRYADKAAKHARAAEIAGNEGNMPDMIEDAELSLDHAKEARRASNNPDLAAGIAALRQAISLGQTHEVPGARVGPSAQTIKGELSRSGNSSRDGGEQYVVRDSQNREVPISLTPEMSRQVQVGDVVEAQVDSNGQVTSISKAQ
jgi:hypothetical protein